MTYLQIEIAAHVFTAYHAMCKNSMYVYKKKQQKTAI